MKGGWFVRERTRLSAGLAASLLAASFLLPGRAVAGLALFGTCLALAGQALRMWAAGHLTKDLALTTSGPFAYTRNPLYLGSLMMGLGFCLASDLPWAVLAVAGLFLVSYMPTIRQEEQRLAGLFGQEYAAYVGRVPRLLPRPRTEAGAGAFSLARALENGEGRTAALCGLVLTGFWLARFLGR